MGGEDRGVSRKQAQPRGWRQARKKAVSDAASPLPKGIPPSRSDSQVLRVRKNAGSSPHPNEVPSTALPNHFSRDSLSDVHALQAAASKGGSSATVAAKILGVLFRGRKRAGNSTLPPLSEDAELRKAAANISLLACTRPLADGDDDLNSGIPVPRRNHTFSPSPSTSMVFTVAASHDQHRGGVPASGERPGIGRSKTADGSVAPPDLVNLDLTIGHNLQVREEEGAHGAWVLGQRGGKAVRAAEGSVLISLAAGRTSPGSMPGWPLAGGGASDVDTPVLGNTAAPVELAGADCDGRPGIGIQRRNTLPLPNEFRQAAAESPAGRLRLIPRRREPSRYEAKRGGPRTRNGDGKQPVGSEGPVESSEAVVPTVSPSASSGDSSARLDPARAQSTARTHPPPQSHAIRSSLKLQCGGERPEKQLARPLRSLTMTAAGGFGWGSDAANGVWEATAHRADVVGAKKPAVTEEAAGQRVPEQVGDAQPVSAEHQECRLEEWQPTADAGDGGSNECDQLAGRGTEHDVGRGNSCGEVDPRKASHASPGGRLLRSVSAVPVSYIGESVSGALTSEHNASVSAARLSRTQSLLPSTAEEAADAGALPMVTDDGGAGGGGDGEAEECSADMAEEWPGHGKGEQEAEPGFFTGRSRTMWGAKRTHTPAEIWRSRSVVTKELLEAFEDPSGTWNDIIESFKGHTGVSWGESHSNLPRRGESWAKSMSCQAPARRFKEGEGEDEDEDEDEPEEEEDEEQSEEAGGEDDDDDNDNSSAGRSVIRRDVDGSFGDGCQQEEAKAAYSFVSGETTPEPSFPLAAFQSQETSPLPSYPSSNGSSQAAAHGAKQTKCRGNGVQRDEWSASEFGEGITGMTPSLSPPPCAESSGTQQAQRGAESEDSSSDECQVAKSEPLRGMLGPCPSNSNLGSQRKFLRHESELRRLSAPLPGGEPHWAEEDEVAPSMGGASERVRAGSMALRPGGNHRRAVSRDLAQSEERMIGLWEQGEGSVEGEELEPKEEEWAQVRASTKAGTAGFGGRQARQGTMVQQLKLMRRRGREGEPQEETASVKSSLQGDGKEKFAATAARHRVFAGRKKGGRKSGEGRRNSEEQAAPQRASWRAWGKGGGKGGEQGLHPIGSSKERTGENGRQEERETPPEDDEVEARELKRSLTSSAADVRRQERGEEGAMKEVSNRSSNERTFLQAPFEGTSIRWEDVGGVGARDGSVGAARVSFYSFARHMAEVAAAEAVVKVAAPRFASQRRLTQAELLRAGPSSRRLLQNEWPEEDGEEEVEEEEEEEVEGEIQFGRRLTSDWVERRRDREDIEDILGDLWEERARRDERVATGQSGPSSLHGSGSRVRKEAEVAAAGMHSPYQPGNGEKWQPVSAHITFWESACGSPKDCWEGGEERHTLDGRTVSDASRKPPYQQGLGKVGSTSPCRVSRQASPALMNARSEGHGEQRQVTEERSGRRAHAGTSDSSSRGGGDARRQQINRSPLPPRGGRAVTITAATEVVRRDGMRKARVRFQEREMPPVGSGRRAGPTTSSSPARGGRWHTDSTPVAWVSPQEQRAGAPQHVGRSFTDGDGLAPTWAREQQSAARAAPNTLGFIDKASGDSVGRRNGPEEDARKSKGRGSSPTAYPQPVARRLSIDSGQLDEFEGSPQGTADAPIARRRTTTAAGPLSPGPHGARHVEWVMRQTFSPLSPESAADMASGELEQLGQLGADPDWHKQRSIHRGRDAECAARSHHGRRQHPLPEPDCSADATSPPVGGRHSPTSHVATGGAPGFVGPTISAAGPDPPGLLQLKKRGPFRPGQNLSMEMGPRNMGVNLYLPNKQPREEHCVLIRM